MKNPASTLLTPVFLKTKEEMPWPEEQSVFHLVTADGLYLCRNHEFFVSSAPTTQWPQELAGHAAFLRLKYPKIPQRLFEQIIGFFGVFAEAYNAEAAALLAWNGNDSQLEVVIPPQRSLVSSGWSGKTYPLSVEYDMPPLPGGWRWLGDLHSHGSEPPYASAMDEKDEHHRPGLHIIVGCLNLEPPEFEIQAVVDRVRFRVRSLDTVVEGYRHRRSSEVPAEWRARVEVLQWSTQGTKIRLHPRDDAK